MPPEIVLNGSVKESRTPSPAWCAARSLIATGTGGDGGTGSPGAPHPAAIKKTDKRKWKIAKTCAGRFVVRNAVPIRFSIFQFQELQDVAAQILVFDDVRELLGDVSGVYLHVLFLQVGRLK